MNADDHFSALQPAADARLLFTLTWSTSGHEERVTVVPADRHVNLSNGAMRFLRLRDGTEVVVDRAQVNHLEIESLVYDMAHLMIEHSSKAVRELNRILVTRRRPGLDKQSQIDLALRIAQLDLVLLEIRLTIDLPASVRASAVQHHKLSIPEVLLAHYPKEEQMPLADRDEFLDRFIEQHNDLVDGVHAYQASFRGRGTEHRDVFWYFLREVAGFRNEDDNIIGEMAASLNHQLQELDIDGYVKEITVPETLSEHDSEVDAGG